MHLQKELFERQLRDKEIIQAKDMFLSLYERNYGKTVSWILKSILF